MLAARAAVSRELVFGLPGPVILGLAPQFDLVVLGAPPPHPLARLLSKRVAAQVKAHAKPLC